MKKILVLLFSLFLLLSSTSVFAINVSFSCEGAVVAGNIETLKPELYDNVYPTIIINSQKKEVSFSYLKHERTWNTIFKIIGEDESSIMATNYVDASYLDIFYFNKKEQTFSLAYVGEYGNTTNYGKCFD